MNKVAAVVSNSLLFFLTLAVAAYTAQYNPTIAVILALASLDPLNDVYTYLTKGAPEKGVFQLALEVISLTVSVLTMIIALLYLSYGFLMFPLLLLAVSTLNMGISIAEARAAFSTRAIETPYLE